MASDFHLLQPSNASMSTFPNNTLAQYVTNLPRRISLSGEWECGLTEIHYPYDWYNVRNEILTVATWKGTCISMTTITTVPMHSSGRSTANNPGARSSRTIVCHPESVHGNEGRHDVHVVRRSDRYTGVPQKT